MRLSMFKITKRTILLLLALVISASAILANGGYEIKVKVEGFTGQEIYLAYHYGDKQYIKDTVTQKVDDYFVMSGEEPLPPGFYLVVLPPDNNFFQLLIDGTDQEFMVTTTAANPAQHVKVEGSEENELFYNYMNMLSSKRPQLESLQKEMEAAADATKKQAVQDRIDELNQSVVDYQRQLVEEHPASYTAAIIRSGQSLDIPEYAGTEEEVQRKRWEYTKKHYFDNLDLSDPRMLRTPFLFQRIDYFVNKLQAQHPDSLSKAIDYVLQQAQPSEETFKFYLIHFLNSFAQSKIVGMDAVYVHLVDEYYAKGLAPWTEEEQLKKIVDNANTLRPLLIGKIAPDIQLQRKDGTPVRLHEVDAEYTVLYFWRYDCGHCKESTPVMKEFYEKFKDKGVEIMAVCVKFTEDVPDCWKYIEDNEIKDWLHTVDPYHRSRFSVTYDIKSTPQIYVLDRNKEIISKKIDAVQLEELMNHVLSMKEEK